MPVDVHGVDCGQADAGEVDAHARVVAPVVHGAKGVEDGGAQLGFEEERVVEVAEIGDIVHEPDELAGFVVDARDDNVNVEVGVRDGDGEEGHGDVERVVLASKGRDECRLDGNVAGRVGRNGRVRVFVVDGGRGFKVVASVDVATAGAVRLDAMTSRNLAGYGRERISHLPYIQWAFPKKILTWTSRDT